MNFRFFLFLGILILVSNSVFSENCDGAFQVFVQFKTLDRFNPMKISEDQGYTTFKQGDYLALSRFVVKNTANCISGSQRLILNVTSPFDTTKGGFCVNEPEAIPPLKPGEINESSYMNSCRIPLDYPGIWKVSVISDQSFSKYKPNIWAVWLYGDKSNSGGDELKYFNVIDTYTFNKDKDLQIQTNRTYWISVIAFLASLASILVSISIGKRQISINEKQLEEQKKGGEQAHDDVLSLNSLPIETNQLLTQISQKLNKNRRGKKSAAKKKKR